jgi:hypothetical protein
MVEINGYDTIIRHFTPRSKFMSNETSEQKPALTIVVQSWATPAAAMIMLVIGLLAGYFGRPLLQKDGAANTPGNSPVAAGTTPVIPPTSAVSNVAIPTITSGEELMTYLVSQANHFKGSADAPVTIIEFSDFQ